MKTLFVLIFIALFDVVFSETEEESGLNCTDVGNLFIGSIFTRLSEHADLEADAKTNFFLATKENPDIRLITNTSDLSELQKIGFNFSRKTYIIIHGFQSHYLKPWITQLTENLLKIKNVNVLLIDWKKGSLRWNYVDSVKLTVLVRLQIFNFLEEIKNSTQNLNSSEILWNHFYFIGHSLGAHISGQVGKLLKKDNFFKVERITGLDPAQPCFTDVHENLVLSKDDADFVDGIHTQTGNGGSTDGFGLQKPVGHADFYVNGGVMQAACEKGIFYTVEINSMVCSHLIVCDYFIESVMNSESNEKKFLAHQWNRTYEDALRILENKKKNSVCTNCTEMGLNASKDKNLGTFFVFAGVTSPYYELKVEDTFYVAKNIERLKQKNILFSNTNNNLMTRLFEFNNPFSKK